MLADKVAIVTGGGSGIGRATSILFAQHGAKVLVVDFNGPSADETAAMITADHGAAIGMKADVGSEADNEAIVAAAMKQWGRLDVFFANAGVSGGLFGTFDTTTAEDFAELLRVNTIGAHLGIKYAHRAMRQNGEGAGGSIILTASVAGIRSGAGGTAYSASKAAVVSLAQTCANQLAGTNIRVNSICPGLIETGMTKPMFDFADNRGSRHKIGQLNPQRRYGEPSEIAGAALFLACPMGSYVNGQSLAVCGGLSSSHPVVPGKLS